MLLSQARQRFLRYCAAERNCSPETIKAYRQSTRRFSDWLAAHGHGDPPVAAITAEIGRDYLYYLSGLGLRPRSIFHLFLPLRSLYRMLVRQKYVPESPFLAIELPKKDSAERQLVTDEELEQLVEMAGRQADPVRAARDQAVFAVMAFCGLRRSELLNLYVADVDLARGTLLVRHGKGEKSRRLPLNDRAKAILGHAQLGTTAVYLHTHEEDVFRIGPLTDFRGSGSPAARAPAAEPAPDSAPEPKEISLPYPRRHRFLRRP
jgi:site-specific recombinase XerD